MPERCAVLSSAIKGTSADKCLRRLARHAAIARWKPRRSLVASMLVIHACLIAAATSSPPDAMHIFAANAALLMPAHEDVDASPEEISIVSAQSFNSCEEVRAAGACEHPLAQAHCKVSCPQPDLSNFWRARDKTV